jgi:hypothetical protein
VSFYRKLCRNCKCKKEEHDVRDDEGYEQFEILFASSGIGKKKRTGACKFKEYLYFYKFMSFEAGLITV